MKGHVMDILLLTVVALLTIWAPSARADCSDRSYNCILNAAVRYDKTTNTATKVDASCTGDPVKRDASCTAGVGSTNTNNLEFLASGTSAGSITLGRCFQLLSGCLPNQCKKQETAEARCSRMHPQCAGSCTAVCTDACSNH
ncbi:hypothetical protein CVIRNUC_004186 [Coccomyxa viridis]|uniref:Extracellular protein n=1 Tax=Coccomyxa viridis TaxID=1274662 RepID=A0AAV1I2D8_9CHLO|nr:hypothetical protein CVIRNUC_004186 [Coccomyxa viridis]